MLCTDFFERIMNLVHGWIQSLLLPGEEPGIILRFYIHILDIHRLIVNYYRLSQHVRVMSEKMPNE